MSQNLDVFKVYDIYEDDPIFRKYSNLKISNITPSYYLILRSIVGNIKLEQVFRNDIFEQNIDYLDTASNPLASNMLSNSNEDVDVDVDVEPNEHNKTEIDKEKNLSLNNIIHLLSNKTSFIKLQKYLEDLNLEDLNELIIDRKISFRNKAFYDNLANEFFNFYYFTYKENHTIAYLHLYRILEYISYTFPLLYSLKTKDFSKSFDSLRTLFSGEKDKGELKVFKDFIVEIFSKEKNYERMTIDINIISNSDEYNEKIFKTLKNICSKDIFDSTYEVENSKLSVKFTEFSSFIITIRNRFFHLKNSQASNIHSIDIIDSEHFFSLINKKCAYFISLLTFEIIAKSSFNK